MKVSGNSVLITGGATGIGLALAEAFHGKGNEVAICGRREEKLAEARRRLPGLHAMACDLSKASERKALFEWADASFPGLNVLVNNAGIQRTIDLRKGIPALEGEDEIEVNFKACVELCAYFIPGLMERGEAAILNVSSGLGFVPMAQFPVYCATKAAIHSFSISLRHQLKATAVKVFELIPPTVDTELNPESRAARAREGRMTSMAQPAVVAEAALEAMEKDEYETAVAMAETLRTGSRTSFEETFNRINR